MITLPSNMRWVLIAIGITSIATGVVGKYGLLREYHLIESLSYPYMFYLGAILFAIGLFSSGKSDGKQNNSANVDDPGSYSIPSSKRMRTDNEDSFAGDGGDFSGGGD